MQNFEPKQVEIEMQNPTNTICNKNSCKCKNNWSYYLQIILITISAMIAISIAIYSIPTINKNYKDILTANNLTGSTCNLLNTYAVELIPIDYTVKTLYRQKAKNIYKYLQKYSQEISDDYNLNSQIYYQVRLVNIMNKKWRKLNTEFMLNLPQNATSTQIALYRKNNIKQWESLLVKFNVMVDKNIDKLRNMINDKMIPKVINEADTKTKLIIYITISLGCFELIGVIFLLKNLYKLINAESNITHMETNVCDMQLSLIKRVTENEVQNNIISMLSHDLKGSAVNIVGELTILEDKLSENDAHKDQINRTIYEAVHIQKCIRSLQIKSEIIKKIYKSKFKDFNLYKLLEIFNYKFKKLLKINIPENCSLYSNEDIFYNIFQNAIKNGIKHGELNKLIDLNILYNDDTDTIDIQVINNPGKNHNKIRNLQEEHGENAELPCHHAASQENRERKPCRATTHRALANKKNKKRNHAVKVRPWSALLYYKSQLAP